MIEQLYYAGVVVMVVLIVAEFRLMSMDTKRIKKADELIRDLERTLEEIKKKKVV